MTRQTIDDAAQAAEHVTYHLQQSDLHMAVAESIAGRIHWNLDAERGGRLRYSAKVGIHRTFEKKEMVDARLDVDTYYCNERAINGPRWGVLSIGPELSVTIKYSELSCMRLDRFAHWTGKHAGQYNTKSTEKHNGWTA